jgi:hypothetical protein
MMEEKPDISLMSIPIEMIDAIRIKQACTALDTVNLIAFIEKKFG